MYGWEICMFRLVLVFCARLHSFTLVLVSLTFILTRFSVVWIHFSVVWTHFGVVYTRLDASTLLELTPIPAQVNDEDFLFVDIFVISYKSRFCKQLSVFSVF